MTNNNLSEDALRKAQKDILLQNEKLKAIFACTPDAIIIIDSNINITDCNEKFLDLFCYTREEIIGKNSMSLVAERDRERTIADSKKVLFENVSTSDEYTAVKSNGEEFVSEASTSVLKDASGHPIGIVVAIRDATERKKAEEQIRLLSSVAQQAVEGIAVSDTKGRVIFLNSAWLKIHEYDEKEAENLIGEGILQFYFAQQLEMIYKNNQYDGVFRGRLKQVRKNGTAFTTLATLSPLRNNKGELIGTIHTAKKLTDIVRDIQDIKSLNLQAEQKNEGAVKDN